MRSLPFRSCVLLLLSAATALAQRDATLESALSGQQVVLKIDMPGSQKGVDLRFNKSDPLDWKDYGKRLKEYGVAIRKGDTARITSVVRKSDMIEVQFDGGGYGTFGDDTRTSIAPTVVDKSDYEKQLEHDISNTDDPDRKRQLQRDLDRERSRRDRENAANRREAQMASQVQASKVADSRARGGSRFNLRWSGSIPEGMATPGAVERLLADYVQFSGASSAAVSPNPLPDADAPSPPAGGAAQLKRGMTMAEVTAILGPNRQVSSTTGSDGLKTDVEEYTSGDHRIEVTFVEGIVIRYTISSQ